MAERIKTDARMTPKIHREMQALSRTLGMPQNAVISIGVAMFRAQMTPLLDGSAKKRRKILDEIFAELEEFFETAKALT